jgi:FkbM family methyltransferase
VPFETYEAPFVSYAQAREDVVLVRSLRSIVPEDGFYIDVGAFHPHLDSVTKAFYDVGWSGINVEPSPKLMLPFLDERPRDINLNMALSSTPGELTFFHQQSGQLGTLEARYADESWNKTAVPVTTLTIICEEHAPRDIHFLKIDVEGHERNVLEGMDFSRFRPWIMIIEAVVPNTHVPTHHEWENIVLRAGYRFVLADAINRFYLANEHLYLQPNFTLVADNFLQYRERWNFEAAHNRNVELEQQLSTLRLENDQLRSETTKSSRWGRLFGRRKR